MKKTALIVLLLATISIPLNARLKDQARNLEKGVQKLASSHHRLWKIARTLWARVQYLEKELEKTAIEDQRAK
jgi:hypothetical protein